MNGHNSHKPMPENGLSERDERDLVALADGSLQGTRRQEVEARVASSPELGAALARQRAGLTALRALDQLAAPAGLRARVNAERSTPSPAVRRRRFQIGFAIAGAMAAVALATVLVLPSGTGGPTISEAAKLNVLPATEPAPPPNPAEPVLLEASAEGLPYPNLEGEFGWSSAGQRQDEIEGRQATTVFYERGGKRIGYTILSGEGIKAPGDTAKTQIDDVTFSSFADGGQEIVTWWRDGHTCVMSGEGVSPKELVALASWKGDGAVPF
jgi:hypothetical protein